MSVSPRVTVADSWPARSTATTLSVFARQQEVAPSVVDINQLSLRIEWMLRRLLGEQIELALKLSPQAVSVWADASQLEQVLVNLAVNATRCRGAGP